MRSKRIFATVAAVTAAATCATAGTAFAADDAWHVTDKQTQNGYTLSQSANGRILTSDAATHTILVDCKVTTLATPAMGTGFKQCYLLGADGRRFDVAKTDATPGPVAMTSAVMKVARQRYRTCVQANALFPSFYMEATPVCTP